MTLGLIVAHAGLLLFDSLSPALASPESRSRSRAQLPPGVHRDGSASRGWLAAILGLSFYARKSIGTQEWRGFMHRFTIVVYLLAVGPT